MDAANMPKKLPDLLEIREEQMPVVRKNSQKEEPIAHAQMKIYEPRISPIVQKHEYKGAAHHESIQRLLKRKESDSVKK